VAAYHRRLTGENPAARLEAAKAWSLWEAATITLLPNDLAGQFGEDRYALAFARIENHYFTHGGWLAEDQLVQDAGKLAAIDGVIVQGRYDVATPMRSAWRLAKAWPRARFEIVPDAGHAFDEPGILDRLIRATDAFAGI
jgi:proline iminopeptidase